MAPPLVMFRPQVERRPIHRTLAQIREKAASVPDGPQISGVYGFTEPHFRFFHNHMLDWKPVAASPGQVSFQGIYVGLNVRVDVYLPSEYQRWPDVLEPIVRHEDAHVADARSIVERSLPSHLKQDPTFKAYFVDREPISEATWRFMIPNRIADLVEKTFDELWNDAVERLDTAANYAPVADAVGAALRRHHP